MTTVSMKIRNLCSKVDLGAIHGVPQHGCFTLPKNPGPGFGGSIKSQVVMPIKITDTYNPPWASLTGFGLCASATAVAGASKSKNMKEPTNIKNIDVPCDWWDSSFR